MQRITLIALLLCVLNSASADVQTLLQLADYMGVDYADAVQEGVIINQGEYEEMIEFSRRIHQEIGSLPEDNRRVTLANTSGQLEEAVTNRADPALIADLTRTIREWVMTQYDVVLTPRTAPDLVSAASLYASECVSCHGADGYGDGPASMGLEPPPINFRDAQRAQQRSLYGLYNTLTLGVEGTSMVGRPDLTDRQRWSLAFYIGGLYIERSNGPAASNSRKPTVSLREAVTLTPAEMAKNGQDGAALVRSIRLEPASLFQSASPPLDITVRYLATSLEHRRAGRIEQAESEAIRAYLEGFELIEAPLANLDNDLMRRTERGMMAYRNSLQQGRDLGQAELAYAAVTQLLEQARERLSGDQLTAGVAFTGSLIILLREGLEAILVLAAILAFLSRSGRPDAVKYVHVGWISALIAGLLTWVASIWLIDISGVAREMTEGVAALAAAVILLYVGFWMHRNSDVRRWSRYLSDQMTNALNSRTLWTLFVVSFLAVYREVFETILFYQALWAQVDEKSGMAVFYGGGLAVVLLVLTTWLVVRFSVRLPLRQFFVASAFLMVALAFVFAGKGVMALQEAGKIPSSPVPFPTIDLLGVYPSVQSLTLQAIVLLLAIAAVVRERRVRKPLADGESMGSK